jgi:hypothetical protein
MTKKDWQKKGHAELYLQEEMTWAYLSMAANRTRMGLDGEISTWLDNEFNPPRIEFSTAYLAWENPATRTPIIASKLKDTEAVFMPLYRKLYSGFLRENPLVTNEDLKAMGLPERSGRHSEPSPIPTTQISATANAEPPGIIIIHYQNKESTSKAKPKGVHGAEIRWAILEKAPTKYEELIHSSFDTRTPFRLEFDNDQRGKTLYFAMRWENTRGEKGPWCPIQAIIIP